MKIIRLLAVIVLMVLGARVANADSILDTRFNVSDPAGSGTFPIVITSNQFMTDGDGGFDLSGTYSGSPIFSLEFLIPAQDIVGSLSCASNVFLVTVIQASGSNPGICFFNSTTSLGLAKLFPPDLTGMDDSNGFNCSWRDLDDCIGIRTGHFVDLGIPEAMPSAPNSTFDLAANGAPLPSPEPGSGTLLLTGLAGVALAGRKLAKRRGASEFTA